MLQHPAPAAKHLNITFALQRKTWEYFISERFLAANPGHKTIYFFTSPHFILQTQFAIRVLRCLRILRFLFWLT